MQAMIRMLLELGVSLDSEEHKSYKFKAGGFMDLSVEVWKEGVKQMVSITHYGEQNGDLMADPDILCQVGENMKMDKQYKLIKEPMLIPVHFQNDYAGIFQEAIIYKNKKILVSPSLTKELNSFLSQWAKNLKNQGFKKENVIKAVC